jgi:hypothetical protein
LPLLTARVHVFGIDAFGGVEKSGFHVFKPVGLLTDVTHRRHLQVAPLKQSNRLPAAWLPIRIRSLRLRMALVLSQEVPVRLDACDATAAMVPFVVMR